MDLEFKVEVEGGWILRLIGDYKDVEQNEVGITNDINTCQEGQRT